MTLVSSGLELSSSRVYRAAVKDLGSNVKEYRTVELWSILISAIGSKGARSNIATKTDFAAIRRKEANIREGRIKVRTWAKRFQGRHS